MAIDTTATRSMTSILDTLLQMSSMAQQTKWRADEAELAREFTKEQNELNAAAENFAFLRQRKAALEDEMRGYTLPYKTKTGGEMISGTLESYKVGSESMITKIDQLTQSLALIADAKTFAKGQADQYGDIIAAGKDEAWRDYLLEGTLEMGVTPGRMELQYNPELGYNETVNIPGKEGLVGTGEMASWLERQSPETIENLKDENYRRSMMSSLRTIEEAKNLQMIDQQMDATRIQIEAAQATIREKNFSFALQQHEEIEKSFGEMYKNTSLSVKANFRYVSDNVPYKLTDLTNLAASDPEKFIDIKNDFLTSQSNYAIAAEAESFITGIQTAASMGMDDSEWVVRFQKAAYDDFLLLREHEERLTKEGAEEGRTLAQMISALPDNDPAKLDITRLRAKHEGYKKLGLFAGGFEILNRSSAMVGMHNLQQADRLAMDIDESTRISQEGLGLPPIEDFYPSNIQQMTPKEVKDLEIALSTISAFTPPTGGEGDAQTIGEKAMSIPGIQAMGWTVDMVNEVIYNQGIDIYNLGAIPLNYLTTLLTGYNPGFTGSEVMQPFATAVGLTEEKLEGPPYSYYRDFAGEGGTILGVPPGKASWSEDENSIEDSLNAISNIPKR